LLAGIDQEPLEEAAGSTRRPDPTEPAPPPLPSILEALFFAAYEPLSSDKLSQMIRGLTPEDLSTHVAELNQLYRRRNCPYHIQLQKEGYRMVLRPRYRPLLEDLFGSVKEVRLSQLAIETLSIVAYRQPISADATEAILGQPCAASLRQLLKRGLIQITARNEEQMPLYGTTPRFLEFFHLTKVDELPRADDLERL
ncbi:MAG TPA: SMC-Scp complex subunit ScpB, partial [Gemmatales bacterium]|nr:SMC-Scp complex subunit ScpB [Gemmatales bacterium]